jgi:predicted O-methyltransferase YrrM
MAFEGITFIQAHWFWTDVIPPTHEKITYLEIGAHSGSNAISVAQTYGTHIDSKIYCIDPWCDYDDYDEYKGLQDKTYSNFLKNVKAVNLESKIVSIRGFSNTEIPKFEDSFFDMIFIDGNHEPEYVLEDAVLSFRKLKVGGYLIFDDWNFEGVYSRGPNGTTRGIEAFMNAYGNRIKHIKTKWFGDLAQVFIQKIR